MKLKELYSNLKLSEWTFKNEDFDLLNITKNTYIGRDKNNNLSVACKAYDCLNTPIIQKTQLLILNCCLKVSFEEVNGTWNEENLHIITCFSKDKQDIDIFLDLCEIFFLSEKERPYDEVLEVFNTLSSFFSNNINYTDEQLQGLFGELLTMKILAEYAMNNYWHIDEKSKFDFSINRNFQIEVKSTTSSVRIHRFNHEQIYDKDREIYVFSYVFNKDEFGLSLYDLITDVLQFSFVDLKKKLILHKVLKFSDPIILHNMRFEESSLLKNLHIINAQDIPKFNQPAPEGVSNAKYSCVLDNIIPVSLEDFKYCLDQELLKCELNLS